mgnify:CR=1 FL=1
MAKMINPEIEGTDLSTRRSLSAFYNTKLFMYFARDNYTCQVCKKK